MWEAEIAIADRDALLYYGASRQVYGATFGETVRSAWSAIGRLWSSERIGR